MYIFMAPSSGALLTPHHLSIIDMPYQEGDQWTKSPDSANWQDQSIGLTVTECQEVDSAVYTIKRA